MYAGHDGVERYICWFRYHVGLEETGADRFLIVKPCGTNHLYSHAVFVLIFCMLYQDECNKI